VLGNEEVTEETYNWRDPHESSRVEEERCRGSSIQERLR